MTGTLAQPRESAVLRTLGLTFAMSVLVVLIALFFLLLALR